MGQVNTNGPAESILARIRLALDALDPAQRKVARFFLENSDVIGDLPIATVARETGVSAGTVVRTCADLGCHGYREMRILIARDNAIRSLLEQRGHARADGEAGSEGERIIARIRGMLDMLRELPDCLDAGAFNRALEMIRDARGIVIVASGLSSGVAANLESRLLRYGRLVTFVRDPLGQDISASLLKPGDLIIAISGSGENRHTVHAVEVATANGADALAVTSFANSSLATRATTTLVASTPATTFNDELIDTSRLPLDIVIESLTGQLGRGEEDPGGHLTDFRTPGQIGAATPHLTHHPAPASAGRQSSFHHPPRAPPWARASSIITRKSFFHNENPLRKVEPCLFPSRTRC